jgi:hypothetical protein
MAPTHHPNAQALADFLIGDCSPGTAFLIARHVDVCTACGGRVQQMGRAAAGRTELRRGATRTPTQGLFVTVLEGASGLAETVLELRAQAGARISAALALHMAEVLVVEGAFVLDGATYRPGDFIPLPAQPDSDFVLDVPTGLVALATAEVEPQDRPCRRKT